ncbi:hypothetical protein INR49_010192 [Caranx melampygus]|nr:hypothetical protein INR49_010192 [Caranx melampygus]
MNCEPRRRVFLLLCLSSAPCGYNLLSVIFLLASPTHHCSIPAYSNLSQEWIEASIPLQFNLVCSDQWKQPLSSLVYFLGGLFGRKPVMFGAIAILSIFSIAVAFAPSWPIFTVLFFIVGMGQIGCYIVVFVLGSEILTGQTRVLFSSLCLPFVYTFAMMLLPGAAYLTRSWRYLALTMAAPGLACIPLWWAVAGSRAGAEVGSSGERGWNLQTSFLSAKAEKTTSQETESVNFLDLLRTKNIRCTTLILWFIWFAMTLAYFGFSFNMSSLYGNPS